MISCQSSSTQLHNLSHVIFSWELSLLGDGCASAFSPVTSAHISHIMPYLSCPQSNFHGFDPTALHLKGWSWRCCSLLLPGISLESPFASPSLDHHHQWHVGAIRTTAKTWIWLTALFMHIPKCKLSKYYGRACVYIGTQTVLTFLKQTCSNSYTRIFLLSASSLLTWVMSCVLDS